jgi:hypothetical protein
MHLLLEKLSFGLCVAHLNDDDNPFDVSHQIPTPPLYISLLSLTNYLQTKGKSL